MQASVQLACNKHRVACKLIGMNARTAHRRISFLIPCGFYFFPIIFPVPIVDITKRAKFDLVKIIKQCVAYFSREYFECLICGCFTRSLLKSFMIIYKLRKVKVNLSEFSIYLTNNEKYPSSFMRTSRCRSFLKSLRRNILPYFRVLNSPIQLRLAILNVALCYRVSVLRLHTLAVVNACVLRGRGL